MKHFLRVVQQKRIRASAVAGLGISGQAPASGSAALNNSEGASQAAAELSAGMDAALNEMVIEDDLPGQLRAEVQRLDSKASDYANSSLDFCADKEPWTCDREEARLISLAWSCAENVYKTDAATEAMEELANSGLNVEWSIPSSTLGTVKATTFTTYTSDPTSAPHLIIAVRGSASRLDHIVNLNSEPRDAGVLFKDVIQNSASDTTMLGLRVHAGFLNSAKELLPQVLNQVAKQLEIFPTTKVLFTGHSAGGAVATLLNLAALKRFATRVATFSCITFGVPPSVMPWSETDHGALEQLILRSQTLNIINEYDMVTRLERGYFRSLVSLYSLPGPPHPESASDGNRSLVTEGNRAAWDFPGHELQHVGPLVVLRVEAPNFGAGPQSSLETGPRLSTWTVPAASFSELLFCKLAVHKREVYRARIKQLEVSVFNRNTGVTSTANEERLQ